MEAEALQPTATKACSTRATARATEPQRIHSHRGHRGAHESEGVSKSAAEEPGSAGDLLKDVHQDQYFQAIALIVGQHL